MKDRISKKMAYLGIGVGTVAFLKYGLLPGSFIGGVLGLKMVGSLFGTPVVAGILERLITASSMIIGATVAALIFLTIASVIGWIIGSAVDPLRYNREPLDTGRVS